MAAGFGALFFGGGAGQAYAQTRHIDYTSMNSAYSTSGNSNPYLTGVSGAYHDASDLSSEYSPDMQKFFSKTTGIEKYLTYGRANLPNGTVTTGNNSYSGQMNHSFGSSFSTNNSSLSGQMDQSPLWQKSYSGPGNIAQKMSSQYDPNNPQTNSALQKMSPYNSHPSDGQLDSHVTGPSKFTDSFVFHTASQYSNDNGLSQTGRELSLQDMNRYMFQGSHSGEPGLPLTQAGGTTSQPTFSSGTSLTSIPATFDGLALRGGIVHSGTSNEIQIMNKDGTKPYQSPQAGFATSNSNSSDSKDSGQEMIYSELVQKPSTNSAPSSTLPTGSTMFPVGTYQATTSVGHNIPVETSAPRIIIRAPKGSKVEPYTPATGQPNP